VPRSSCPQAQPVTGEAEFTAAELRSVHC
jgi:hypothetical protein